MLPELANIYSISLYPHRSRPICNANVDSFSRRIWQTIRKASLAYATLTVGVVAMRVVRVYYRPRQPAARLLAYTYRDMRQYLSPSPRTRLPTCRPPSASVSRFRLCSYFLWFARALRFLAPPLPLPAPSSQVNAYQTASYSGADKLPYIPPPACSFNDMTAILRLKTSAAFSPAW